jgi:hypothetical protein
VPYWDIVVRSFRIAWDRKYLWLLALFSGEGGAQFSSSFNYTQGSRGNRTPDFATTRHQVSTWLSDHAGLVALIVLVWLVLVIAFFILAAICEAGLIRGSAEHDADHPFQLGQAWRAGLQKMWVIVRFRLLLIVLALPVIVLLTAVVVGFVLSVAAGNVVLAVLLGLIGVIALFATIVYAIYLSFLDRLGSRAAILDGLGAVAALGRGNALLFKRFGRTLLVWLVSILVSIVVGIAAGIALLIAAVPALVALAIALAGAAPLFGAAVFFGLVWLLIALPISGFVQAQGSTYWTLAYRRLDVEYPA